MKLEHEKTGSSRREEMKKLFAVVDKRNATDIEVEKEVKESSGEKTKFNGEKDYCYGDCCSFLCRCGKCNGPKKCK